MTSPLFATYAKLLAHFQQSTDILAAAVDTSAQLQIETEFVYPRATGGLIGTGCEYIARNRGRPSPVAPMLHIREGLWVWLGYHEEWNEERKVRNIRRFSFRSVSLSIHFGVRNNLFKPQMFRAEWAGWAKWGGYDYRFPADSAGHPHWQFDALNSLSDETLSDRASELLRRLRDDNKLEIHDFSPTLSRVDVRDLVTVQKLSRVHFSSASAWWKSPPHDAHAHAPNELADIENWVRHSLEYIKRELRRL